MIFKRREFAIALNNYRQVHTMTLVELGNILGCSGTYVGNITSTAPKYMEMIPIPNIKVYAISCKLLKVSLNTFFKH